MEENDGKQKRDEYDRLNGYCDCADMQALYSLRKESQNLADKLKHFEMETDLEKPRQDDLPQLLDYRKTFYRFRSAVGRYYEGLAKMSKQGRLKLIMHSDSGDREVAFGNAAEKREDVVTIHCARCNQQIEVAAAAQSGKSS